MNLTFLHTRILVCFLFCVSLLFTACTTRQPSAPLTHIPPEDTSSTLPPQNLSNQRKTILSHTLQSIGTPYAWGGNDPDRGFDCSGLVSYAHDSAGIIVPRTASAQFRKGRPVPKTSLLPGDLVFFSGSKKKTGLHVGIYIGNGKFVHAPGRGRTVSIAFLDNIYFRNHFLGARSYTQPQ